MGYTGPYSSGSGHSTIFGVSTSSILSGLGTLLGIGLLVGVIALFLVLFPPIREGSVQQTWLVPAHWETYESGKVCLSYNTDGGCSFSMPIYDQRWIEDRCWVRIYNETHDRTGDIRIACNTMGEYPPKRYVRFN